MPTLKLHEYQEAAFMFALQRWYDGELGAALFLDPGLGKTITTLKLLEFLTDFDDLGRTLIIGPKRPLETAWPKEVDQWDVRLSCAYAMGSKRKREVAVRSNANIVFINQENVKWLAQESPKWDTIVVDESTGFKNFTSERMKALRRMLKYNKRRLILTGTPSPNSYADLFSQLFIVDDGALLGRTLGEFRRHWCRRGGYEYHDWIFRDDLEEKFRETIAPLCLYMDAETYLDMPEITYNEISVKLDHGTRKIYESIEDEMFAELPEQDLVASSAGSKYLLCRQIANGQAYYYGDEILHGEREVIALHQHKVDALADLYEGLHGKQLIVAFNFSHDLEAIRERFPKCSVIQGGTSGQHLRDIIAAWQREEVGMLAVQCQAMSHGVDGLQANCNDVCWFGLTDQPEIHTQLNRRVWRQGVRNAVRIHYLLAEGTIDRAILRRLRGKDGKQLSLLQALKEYRDGRNE